MIKRFGKYVLAFYVAQALVGIGVGVYIGLTFDQAEVERIVSCVAH